VDALSTKKEFPSQTENRKQWIIDTVRNNQKAVTNLLLALHDQIEIHAETILHQMHKHDQDALLLPNGILTNEQIEILSPGRLSTDTEADQ